MRQEIIDLYEPTHTPLERRVFLQQLAALAGALPLQLLCCRYWRRIMLARQWWRRTMPDSVSHTSPIR